MFMKTYEFIIFITYFYRGYVRERCRNSY